MTISEAMAAFRADYDLATARAATQMTTDLRAQGASAESTESQIDAFIEQRLDDRESAVEMMRAKIATYALAVRRGDAV